MGRILGTLLRACLKINSQSHKKIVNIEALKTLSHQHRVCSVQTLPLQHPEPSTLVPVFSMFCQGYYKEMTANFFLILHSLLKSPPM